MDDHNYNNNYDNNDDDKNDDIDHELIESLLVSIAELQAKTRRLEMENQRLVSLLSNMKEAHFRENAERILQLEDENTRLKLKVEDLEDDQRGKEGKMSEMIDAVSSRAAQAEKKNLDLQRTQQEQKNTIEALKVPATLPQILLQHQHKPLINSITRIVLESLFIEIEMMAQ